MTTKFDEAAQMLQDVLQDAEAFLERNFRVRAFVIDGHGLELHYGRVPRESRWGLTCWLPKSDGPAVGLPFSACSLEVRKQAARLIPLLYELLADKEHQIQDSTTTAAMELHAWLKKMEGADDED